MLIASWILQGLLALLFLIVGILKIVRDRQQLVDADMRWALDFAAPFVKALGVAEVLGAIGLIVPPLVGIVPVLTPIAAICLAILMVGAVTVHLRRGEPGPAAGSAAVGALLVVVAILRFVFGG